MYFLTNWIDNRLKKVAISSSRLAAISLVLKVYRMRFFYRISFFNVAHEARGQPLLAKTAEASPPSPRMICSNCIYIFLLADWTSLSRFTPQNWQNLIRFEIERFHVIGQLSAYPRFSPHEGQRSQNNKPRTAIPAPAKPMKPTIINALLIVPSDMPPTKTIAAMSAAKYKRLRDLVNLVLIVFILVRTIVILFFIRTPTKLFLRYMTLANHTQIFR